MQRLQELVSEYVERGEIAGVNGLVLQEGKELAYFQAGCRNLESQEKMSRNTICRLYSMSKPITAAAVMILLERGNIDLMDWVSDYLPGFENQMVAEGDNLRPAACRMTIRHLLSMTSGLCYPGDVTLAEQKTGQVYAECEQRLYSENPMSTMEFAEKIGQCPLKFDPDQSWGYGTSADILGAIVGAVSGMKFSEFLNENIFEPLGMEDTAFYVPSEKQSRLAKSYEYTEGKLKEYRGEFLAISSRMEHAPWFESGGAGLCSTIDDYAKFASMLINGGTYSGKRILSEASVQYMTTAELMPKNQAEFLNWDGMQGFSYGNLMRIMKRPEYAVRLALQGEYGWDGWLGPFFLNAPKEKLTFLLMLQRANTGTFSLTRKLVNTVIQQI